MAVEVDAAFPAEQHVDHADADAADVGHVAITHVVTARQRACQPRIQVIYAIPGQIELGETTNVEVRTQNLVGDARVEFAVDDEAEHQARIELAELNRCALGSAACRELTCVGLDDSAEIELDDGRRAGNARVAVTVEDDECRDTEYVSVECVEPAAPPARCGDGIVEGGEACDDGNAIERDGCGSDCTPSPEPHCGDDLLDEGEACDGTAGLVAAEAQLCAADCTIIPVCGNGHTEPPEACDDGNAVDDDGCQADCTLTPPAVCGNGLLEDGEACDDGNGASGDGCEIDCTPTPAPECGNGLVESSETCDDGNASDGDGCDGRCRLEPRGFCSRFPQAWICELLELLRNRPQPPEPSGDGGQAAAPDE